MLTWALPHAPGSSLLWAIEGCRSHGAGLVRSDPADARLATGEALATTRHAQPRSDGNREALRILLVARDHANTMRTAAINVFNALLLTAPDLLRERLRDESTPRQTAARAVLRSLARHRPAERVLRQTLRGLARRIRLPDREIRDNERQLRELVDEIRRDHARPARRTRRGRR